MHDLSVSLGDLRTIPLWSKWTKDLTLYCLNKIKEIMVLILQNFRKPIRQTILLIGINMMGTVSKLYVSNNTWIYVYIKNLTKFQLQFQLPRVSTPIPTPGVSTPTPTPTPASLLTLEYQLQLQLREFQLQLQLRQVSWISTPTPEVSTPTPELELELNPTPTPELTPTLQTTTSIHKIHCLILFYFIEQQNLDPRGASCPKHFYPRKPITSSVIVETTRFGNSLILTSTVPSNINQIS